MFVKHIVPLLSSQAPKRIGLSSFKIRLSIFLGLADKINQPSFFRFKNPLGRDEKLRCRAAIFGIGLFIANRIL
jgi:hypothetical protein